MKNWSPSLVKNLLPTASMVARAEVVALLRAAERKREDRIAAILYGEYGQSDFRVGARSLIEKPYDISRKNPKWSNLGE
jgi:hypothetical protein